MSRKYSSPVYDFEIPWQIFDLAIFLLLAGFGALHAYGHLRDHALLRVVSGLGFLTIFYGSFIEPRLLKIRKYAIGKGTNTLRIAFLSDLHVGPYKGVKWMRRLVRKTNALKPDLILLGGDLLYHDGRDLPKLEPLKELRASHGVYAILGNHDEHHATAESEAWFAAAGLPLLLNRSVRLEKNGASFSVAGADDDWFGETDLEAAFGDVRSDELAIVMLHNPDLLPPASRLLKARQGKTVFFCGHTHGGQIRLPFIGSVWLLPHHLRRKFDRGVFDYEGCALIIGAGTGESGPRARLLCPPEIVLTEVRF